MPQRPCGPTDKASAYGAGDCRFASCRGHGDRMCWKRPGSLRPRVSEHADSFILFLNWRRARPPALMLDVRFPIASRDRLRRSGPMAQWIRQRIRHRPTEPAPRKNKTSRGLCSEVVSAFGHPAAPRGSQVAIGMLWWSLQIRCSIVASISACHAEDPGSTPGGGERATRKFELGLWPSGQRIGMRSRGSQVRALSGSWWQNVLETPRDPLLSVSFFVRFESVTLLQASLSAGRRPADFCWLPACVTSTHGGRTRKTPFGARTKLRRTSSICDDEVGTALPARKGERDRLHSRPTPAPEAT